MSRILCVDDDETVARLIADIVEFCRHEPIVVTDSLAAITEFIGDPKIGAVLSDFMMPRMDGIEMLACWQERRPSVRRVLITAAPQEESVRKAEREGIVQLVVPKPPAIGDVRLALAWL